MDNFDDIRSFRDDEVQGELRYILKDSQCRQIVCKLFLSYFSVGYRQRIAKFFFSTSMVIFGL